MSYETTDVLDTANTLLPNARELLTFEHLCWAIIVWKGCGS